MPSSYWLRKRKRSYKWVDPETALIQKMLKLRLGIRHPEPFNKSWKGKKRRAQRRFVRENEHEVQMVQEDLLEMQGQRSACCSQY